MFHYLPASLLEPQPEMVWLHPLLLSFKYLKAVVMEKADVTDETGWGGCDTHWILSEHLHVRLHRQVDQCQGGV